MPIMLYGGRILLVDGAIAIDEACCCTTPPDCPDCCLKIEGGTWIDSTHLQFDIADGTITITMPNANKRYICDAESITVEFSISSEPFAVVALFGPAWIGTPGATAILGVDNHAGMIQFDSGTGSFNLTYDKCFSEPSDFLNYLTINVFETESDFNNYTPLFNPIDTIFCTSSCCDDPFCANCCAIIVQSPGNYTVFDGAIAYEYSWNDPWDILLTAKASNNKLCVGGDNATTISVKVVPNRFYDPLPQPCVLAAEPPWTIDGANPGGFTQVDGSVCWPDTVAQPNDDTGYEVNLSWDCPKDGDGNPIPCEDLPALVDVNVTAEPLVNPFGADPDSTVAMGVEFKVENCTANNCCDPCPPCCWCEDPAPNRWVDISGPQICTVAPIDWTYQLQQSETHCERWFLEADPAIGEVIGLIHIYIQCNDTCDPVTSDYIDLTGTVIPPCKTAIRIVISVECEDTSEFNIDETFFVDTDECTFELTSGAFTFSFY